MEKKLLIWLSTQESTSTSTKQDIGIPETTQENLQNSYNFNLCDIAFKASYSPLFTGYNELLPGASSINTSKWTYLMDFPPCSNPKCAIKLSKLCKTHVLTSITCCKCKIPFPPKVKVQIDCKQLLPHKMCKWHFNVQNFEQI